MTSGRRSKQLRSVNGTAPVRPHDDDITAFMLGWAETDAQLDEVSRSLARRFQKQTAQRRSGDVQVTALKGADAHAMVAELRSRALVSGDQPRQDLARRLRALLREHPDGIVVLATAKARRA